MPIIGEPMGCDLQNCLNREDNYKDQVSSVEELLVRLWTVIELHTEEDGVQDYTEEDEVFKP
jgi:hypothetical protein